jgi:phage gp29-like protein
MLAYLDESITRACNGQSLTASAGASGSRAANEVGERDEQRIHRFDAKNLADAWREQVVKPWVRLNYPGQEKLTPICKIGVESDPDPTAVLTTAGAAADLGVEVDAEQIAKRANLPVAKAGAKKLERPAPPPPPDGAFGGKASPGKAGKGKPPTRATGASGAKKPGKPKAPAKDKEA